MTHLPRDALLGKRWASAESGAAESGAECAPMSLPARLSPRDSGGPAQMLGTARQRGVYAYRTEVRAWLLLLPASSPS